MTVLRSIVLATTFMLGGVPCFAAPPAGLPDGLLASKAPADAQDIVAAKKTAKKGDRICVRGRIGGSKSPMIDGRAAFTLVDLELPPCNANPEDGCMRPWDYCCEPAARIAAHAATIQVVDAKGKVIRTGLEGTGGLVPLSELVVAGTVVATDGDKLLLISADAIHVDRLGTCAFPTGSADESVPLARMAPARTGEWMTLRGRIGGSEPFAADFALLTLVGDDNRKVQIRVDDWKERPVGATLEGVNGLAKGDEIVVRAQVVKDGSLPLLRAAKMWRVP